MYKISNQKLVSANTRWTTASVFQAFGSYDSIDRERSVKVAAACSKTIGLPVLVGIAKVLDKIVLGQAASLATERLFVSLKR